ncbi:MAG TPA: tetratricopeptide repeat protein, partial [Opitutaceae bacterium]|nr:tetratricopeptide repeat protein [Opitutaceae bacterium]
IRYRPGYFDAELNLGNVLALEGRLDDAAALLGSLVPEHSDDADLRNDYGTVLAEQGKLEAARDQFGEAVRLRPDFTEARNNLDHVTADLRKASP